MARVGGEEGNPIAQGDVREAMARAGEEKKENPIARGRVVDIRRREVGDVSPRNFARRAAASKDLILRLGIHSKLKSHRGCVNTVSFNADGNILVSGSDDRMIILWDWEAEIVKLSFHSFHSNNVFHARFMPYTDDQVIVTCAADGEVRHAQITNGVVASKLLGKHEGRAHKLAIEPGSPHILYSCGEDGLVQHFDLRAKSATRLFLCESFRAKSTYKTIIPLNAITIDPRNANLFAIGGMDEFARVFDIRKYKPDGSSDFGQPCDCFCPPDLVGNKQVEITGLIFSDHSELLATYIQDSIYLFTKDQGLGPYPLQLSKSSSAMDVEIAEGSSFNCWSSPDATDARLPQVYTGHLNYDTVKGASFFGPNCDYVVCGSDCGRIFIWRKKDGELLRVMKGDEDVVNCIEHHPYATMIASSGIESDIKIWIPNALEPSPPVTDEIFEPCKTGWFSTGDSGDDYDDDDDSDDSADDALGDDLEEGDDEDDDGDDSDDY